MAAAIAVTLAVAAQPALAGEWMQVSCVNPDGSAAPSDGWATSSTSYGSAGSNAYTSCAPGLPMQAWVSNSAPAPVGSAENLGYVPPSGSTLAGGAVDVNLYVDGSGGLAGGGALFYEPAVQYPDDLFYRCVNGSSSSNCPGAADYSGVVALPANRGGNFYLQANCFGTPGTYCTAGGSHGAFALVQIVWAHFLLTSFASPQGAGFSGSALQAQVSGTGHVLFTASDPGGPGVHTVSAAIDGQTVWSGTPNTNGGRCVPVGTDSATGALEFDWQQPCPATEAVDVPVPTASLPNGSHELTVTVTDAAHNSSTVLDQTITTSNSSTAPAPVVTPKPRPGLAVKAQFELSWRWQGMRTTLLRITAERLPRRGTMSVVCSGRGCPKLRPHSVRTARAAKLMDELDGKRFTAGDRLQITVTARGLRPERIRETIRDGQLPSARLLTR